MKRFIITIEDDNYSDEEGREPLDAITDALTEAGIAAYVEEEAQND